MNATQQLSAVLDSSTDATPPSAKPVKNLSDLLAEHEAASTELVGLRAECDILRAEVADLKPANLAGLAAERDGALARAEAAEASLATLKTERDTMATEVAALKVKQVDFDGKVAERVARLGIKTGAAGTAATVGASVKPSLTRECELARGIAA